MITPRCAIKFLLLAIPLLAPFAAGGCAASSTATPFANRQLHAEVPFDPANAVVIEGDSGDVKVRRVDGPARVRADIRGKGSNRLAAVQVVMQTDRVGALSIRVDWPIGWRQPGEAAILEVDLPGCSALTVHTGNGGIDVAGLGGAAELSSGNGEIILADHAGDVQISTSNGFVQADRIDGACRVRTSNGEVTINDVTARVAIATTNGSVDVRLSELNAGPVDIRTANGGVELEIGDGFTGDLRLETFNGRVRVVGVSGEVEIDDEREWAIVRRGGSENRSLIRTTNGRVEVRRRSSVAAN